MSRSYIASQLRDEIELPFELRDETLKKTPSRIVPPISNTGKMSRTKQGLISSTPQSNLNVMGDSDDSDGIGSLSSIPTRSTRSEERLENILENVKRVRENLNKFPSVADTPKKQQDLGAISKTKGQCQLLPSDTQKSKKLDLVVQHEVQGSSLYKYTYVRMESGELDFRNREKIADLQYVNKSSVCQSGLTKDTNDRKLGSSLKLSQNVMDQNEKEKIVGDASRNVQDSGFVGKSQSRETRSSESRERSRSTSRENRSQRDMDSSRERSIDSRHMESRSKYDRGQRKESESFPSYDSSSSRYSHTDRGVTQSEGQLSDYYFDRAAYFLRKAFNNEGEKECRHRKVETVDAATNTDSESELTTDLFDAVSLYPRSDEVKVKVGRKINDDRVFREYEEEVGSKRKKEPKGPGNSNEIGAMEISPPTPIIRGEIGAMGDSPPISIIRGRSKKRESRQDRNYRCVSWEDDRSKSNSEGSTSYSRSRPRRGGRDHSSSDSDSDRDRQHKRRHRRKHDSHRSRELDMSDSDSKERSTETRKRSKGHRHRRYDSSPGSDTDDDRKDSRIRRSLNYDGKSNWNAFYSKFKRMAKRYRWSSRQCKDELCYSFDGVAMEYFCMLEEQDPDMRYTEVVDKMNKRFGYRDLDESIQIQFSTMQQRDDEDIDAWADRVIKLATRTFRSLPESYMAEQAAMRICLGCADKSAAQSALLRRPKTVEAAIEAIKWSRHTNQSIFGNLYTSTRAISGPREEGPRVTFQGRFQGSPPPSPRSRIPKQCFECGDPTHFMRDCPRLAVPKCYHCGATDHFIRNCRKRNRGFQSQKSSIGQNSGDEKHVTRNGPKNQSTEKAENEAGGTGRVDTPPKK